MYIQVNILAILVCAVVYAVIGAIWYSPLVFGKPWSRLSRARVEPSFSREQLVLYLGSFFVGLVSAAILAVIISVAGVVTIWEAVILGVAAWAGFTAAPSFATTIFEGKPFGLWGINVGYPFISTIVMAVIFISWR